MSELPVMTSEQRSERKRQIRGRLMNLAFRANNVSPDVAPYVLRDLIDLLFNMEGDAVRDIYLAHEEPARDDHG